jgi:hypothetical protein
MEDQSNKEKLAQWLNEKWAGGIACPVCKQNDWGLYDQLWELRQFHKGGSLVLGGPIIPLAVITCNNCGHTLHFNALKIGLTTQDNSAQTPKEK